MDRSACSGSRCRSARRSRRAGLRRPKTAGAAAGRARACLDHHELARRRRRGDAGRRQRQHVVVGRQRAIRHHFRRDVDRHRGSILHVRNALSADAQQLGGGACVRDGLRGDAVVQLNPTLPLHPSRLVPIVDDRRPVLRRPPHRDFLRRPGACGSCSRAKMFSPAWISVGVLAWLGAAAAMAGAALMWANLQTFALYSSRIRPRRQRSAHAGARAPRSSCSACCARIWAANGRPVWAACSS